MDVIGSLEVRSEVATSDLEWRRIREHESPCVGVFSEAYMSQTPNPMSCRRLDLCFGSIAWSGMLLYGFRPVVLSESHGWTRRVA